MPLELLKVTREGKKHIPRVSTEYVCVCSVRTSTYIDIDKQARWQQTPAELEEVNLGCRIPMLFCKLMK